MTKDESLAPDQAPANVSRPRSPIPGLFNGRLPSGGDEGQPSRYDTAAFDQNGTSSSRTVPSQERRTPGSQQTSRKSSNRHSGGFLLGHSFGKAKRHSASPGLDGHNSEIRGSLDETTSSPRSSASWKSRGKIPVHQYNHAKEERVPFNIASPTSQDIERLGIPKGPVQQQSWPSGNSQHGSEASGSSAPSDRSSKIDSSQLINMALALSEGRRRAASGIFDAPRIVSPGRVVSTRYRRLSTAPGSPASNQLQKGISARPAPYLSPEPNHAASPDVTAEAGSPMAPMMGQELNDLGFEFSMSTLQRAERARKYFELSHQYRRLLGQLPPLKPNRSAPGNVSVQTRSRPEIPTPIISRTETELNAKHDLGRPYNPLQMLRNERLRKYQGKTLLPPLEDFNDLEKVVDFVDDVEHRCYQVREGIVPDILTLPKWHSQPLDNVVSPSYQKGVAASSKILWFDCAWSFSPMLLFADTLWTEQPENKWAVQNRRGQRIFPDMSPPTDATNTATGPNHSGSARHDRQSGEDKEHRGRNKRKFLSIHKLNDDEGRRRPWRRRRSASSSRASSRSSISAFGTFGGSGADGINIGPLVRHMQKQMEDADFSSPEVVVSADQWDELPPESALSPTTLSPDHMATSDTHARLKLASADLHKAQSLAEGLRRPGGNLANGQPAEDSLTARGGSKMARTVSDNIGWNRKAAPPTTALDHPAQNTNGQIRKPLPSDISHVDFANPGRTITSSDAQGQTATVESVRSSFESLERNSFEQETGTIEAGSYKPPSGSHTDKPDRAHGKSMSKLLKGTRIAELVRGDGIRKLDKDKKHSNGSPEDGEGSIQGSGHSDSEGIKKLERRTTDMSATSISSSSDRPRYHVPLPSFKFPHRSEGGRTSVDVVDPVRQQQDIRKEQSKASRLGKIGPPQIEIPDNDKISSGRGSKDDDSQGLFGLLSPIKRLRSGTGPSRPASLKAAHSAQNSTTDLNLKALEPESKDLDVPVVRRKRQWSIANQLDRPNLVRAQTVTIRDVERVKTLFMSSGIKACELCRRGDVAPNEPSDLLLAPMKHSDNHPSPVAHRDESRMAGRLWSEIINSLHESSEAELQSFRNSRVPQLRSRIDELRHAVGEQLTVKVQATADGVDSFQADLTTHQTLAVKHVHDAIDSLMRRRRRNWRLLRRIGFSVLEWLLLGIMWLAWFVFTLFKIVRCAIWSVFRIVGWLFFLVDTL